VTAVPRTRNPSRAPNPLTAPPSRARNRIKVRVLHRRAFPAERERGSLSLELSILAPVVMLILFTTVEAGFYFFARDVAITAAQQGVEAARVQGGTLAEGEARTDDMLRRAGGSISGAQVTGSTGVLVQITVSGHVATWIPGLSLPVSQTATGIKEAFTP
jgi:Flp pilus assembly protein TadG